MSKRLSSPNGSDGTEEADDSQTGFDEVAAKKRKLVEFESVRLLSVTGVNDIEEKSAKVQVYKLSEAVRYKNKQLSYKEKEFERLRKRQMTDEATSCTINTHWNHLDEQLRLILLRGSTSEDVQSILSSTEPQSNFLEEVVQLNDKERQAAYEKRVQSSIGLLNKILMSQQQKSEQYSVISKKIFDLLEGSTSKEISESQTLKELNTSNVSVTQENEKLIKACTKMQSKFSEASMKVKQLDEKYNQSNIKNEELMKEIDELKHELDKARRQVNKLDFKLYNVIKDQRSNCVPNDNNGSKVSTVNGQFNGDTTKELEDLKAECALQSELAANRLSELKDLSERNLKFVEDMQRVKNEASTITLEKIRSSKEFQDLCGFFSMAMDDNARLRSEYQQILDERDLLRAEMLSIVDEMKREEQLAIRKVLTSSEQISRDHMQVRSEYDMLRMEFEQNLPKMGSSEAKTNEVKTLISSLRSQNSQLKSEVDRTKKKWKEVVNKLAKYQKELAIEKKIKDSSILIDREVDSDGDIPSPETEGDEQLTESQLRSRLKEVRSKLEIFEKMNNEQRDVAEMLSQNRLNRSENKRLRRHIRKMTEMDGSDKTKYFEGECQKIIAAKDMEIAQLKKEAEELTIAETALNTEVETIGQALEELQEQNSTLIKSKQALEESKMTMMGDRIASSQYQQKLQEEKVLLETQVQTQTKLMQTQLCEHQHVNESLSVSKETIASKNSEILKLSKSLETTRKQVIDLTIKSEKLGTSCSKYSDDIKITESKLCTTERLKVEAEHKRKRLEEENSVLRKKVERLRKTEKLGSSDAVYMEEIRQLKEALTCPSCKTGRKDAILTKCFHVFCMKCLKTRYDTRQRKCPKCNAGFGANDFQRAYIS